MKDYYKILKVSRYASSEEIKKSYKKLTLKYHPDINKNFDAEAKIKEINEAYDVLSDDKKRNNYNYKLDNKSNISKPKPVYKTTQFKKSNRYKSPQYDLTIPLKIGNIISGCILLICFLIMLDYSISIEYNNLSIKSFKVTFSSESGGKKGRGLYTYTDSYQSWYDYNVKSEIFNLNFTTLTKIKSLQRKDPIKCEVTPIFGQVKNCFIFTNNFWYEVEPPNIYYPFMIVVIFGVILITILSFILKSKESRMLCCIVAFILCLIPFLDLISNNLLLFGY